jgi:hypothetical protein
MWVKAIVDNLENFSVSRQEQKNDHIYVANINSGAKHDKIYSIKSYKK